MTQNLEIDKLDLEILAILMEDAQTPYTEIAKRLDVSGGTIHVRMRKLIGSGLVRGSHLDIDPSLLGYDIKAFVGVFLEKGARYNDVAKQLTEIEEITEIHYITGSYSIFLKIVCRNTKDLRNVLNDKIQAIGGISRTETFISLEETLIRPLHVLQGSALSRIVGPEPRTAEG